MKHVHESAFRDLEQRYNALLHERTRPEDSLSLQLWKLPDSQQASFFGFSSMDTVLALMDDVKAFATESSGLPSETSPASKFRFKPVFLAALGFLRQGLSIPLVG